MKKKIVFFMIMLIFFVVILLVMSLIGNYFYNYAINANTSKTDVISKNAEPVEDNSAEVDEKTNLTEEEISQNWLLENSKDVYIDSSDGLKLHSYSIEHSTDNKNWAIIVHGYSSQGSEMGEKAEIFYKKGFNTLVVDLRGAGKSEGKYIGMGWHDRLDIISWINYIINENTESKIILYGVSMGAATVMMATGEELPSNVKLAIEDCGYSSVWEEFEYQLNKIFGLKSFPFLNIASITTKIRAGYFFREASCVEQLEKSVTPTLFIHGDSDEFVPSYMINVNYEAAKCEKEKLIIEGAGHARSSAVNPELYWSTVDNFIEKYFNR